MKIQGLGNQKQKFDGSILHLYSKKNNFSEAVECIGKDLSKQLEKKDYNVMFSNSSCNDIYEVSVVDDMYFGAKPISKRIFNYLTIEPKQLMSTVQEMIKTYETENKYNTISNQVKRLKNSTKDDELLNHLKQIFSKPRYIES